MGRGSLYWKDSVVPGTVFEIRGIRSEYQTEATTGADGKATLTGIPVDYYEVTEKSVPAPYVLANEVRARNGAKECAVSGALMDAAQMLAERKLTDHDLKIESGCRAAFGCRHGVACNLYRATNSGTVEYFPQGAVRSWENSPGHCAAMVNGGADSMGVGIHYDRETNTYYCVMFVGCCQTEGRLFGTAHS